MGATPRARAGATPRRRPPPRWTLLRRRLPIALALLLMLAALYQLWFRSSPLVAVEEVSVSGAEQEPSIESRLRSAGLEQSTLSLDLAALELAVADDPAVREVSARADFPHGLEITVELREPVAVLNAGGALIAADGVVLGRGGGAAEGLPTIDAEAGKGGGDGPLSGGARLAARVLGAAPPALVVEVDSASVDPEYGVVVELSSGLELRFGGAEDGALKWRAAAAVLADPELGSVAYLDLTVPRRPVAGGVRAGALEDAAEGATLEGAEPVPTAIEESAAAVNATREAAVEPAAEGGLQTVE
jgi:cell division protein FtsQ